MTVVRFVVLPERLVVLVSLGTSGFSLGVCSRSSGNARVSSRLSALSSTDASICSGLGLLCGNLVLLGQSQRLIGSRLGALHRFGRGAAAQQGAGHGNSCNGKKLSTHLGYPQ